MNLMDQEEFDQMLTERVHGDDWWTFTPVNWFATLIEERFYAPGTPKNAGFEVTFGKSGVFAFARRELLPAKELADVLRAEAGVTVGDLAAHPLLIFHEGGEQ